MLLQAYIINEKLVTYPHYEIYLFVQTIRGNITIVLSEEKAVLFLESDSSILSKFKDKRELKLKNFHEKNVSALYSNNQKQFDTLKEELLSSNTRSYELDVPFIERYLMERFIFREIEFEISEAELDLKLVQNPKLKPVKNLDLNFSYLSFDIETGVNNELYSVSFDYGDTKGTKREGVVFIVGEEKSSDEVIFFPHEKDLLLAFSNKFLEIDPDFIFGWHVIGFDFNFLFNKASEYNMELPLGRDGSKLVVESRNNNSYITLVGRIVVDGPVMMRSNFFHFEDYKLETVASSVLGHGKDIASDEHKVEEIERRFREDKFALAKYNLLDSTLVTDIYFKTGLLKLLVERSKISGLSIDKLHYSSLSFDFSYLPLFHRRGYVAPNISDIVRDYDFEGSGGLVLDSVVGLHDDVIVVDFKSLYPTLMITFNIDPLSYFEGQDNGGEIPSQHKFSFEEAPLSKKLKEFLKRRAEAKERGEKELSQAIKILMNSFYGILGSSRSRFYQAELPDAITRTGQWVLLAAKGFIEREGYEVVYGDTDSLFVKLKAQDKFNVNEVGERLTLNINKYLKKKIADEYGRTSYLEIEYEKHYSKIFFPFSRDASTGAKKRYVGLINGELNFVGMEFVRSDWTKLAKNFQEDLFLALFSGDEIEPLVKSYIERLLLGEFNDDLIYTKRLSKDASEYTKNIPPHVKAALKLNHKGPYRLKTISYVMTENGPEPIQELVSKPDFNHYKEKQLRPIADNILIYLGTSWDNIVVGDQLSLF